MQAKAAKARIERRYRLAEDGLSSVLSPLLAFGEDVAQHEEARFDGSVRLAAAPDVSLDFDDVQSFLGALDGPVLSLDASVFAPYPEFRGLQLNKYRQDGELSLKLSIHPADLTDATSALADAERRAGIEPLTQTDLDTTEQNVRLERQYFCKQPDATRWILLFETILMPMVEPCDIDATVRGAGVDAAEHRYRDLASIRSSLPAAIDRLHLEAVLRSPPFASVSLRFDRSFQAALRVIIDAPKEKLELARSEIDRLEAALDLRRFEEDGDEQRDRVGPKVTCFTRGRLDQDWFRKACEAINELEPWPRWFNGRLSERSDGSEQMSHSSLGAWRTSAIKRWPRVCELGADMDGHTYGIAVHLEPRLDFVRLQVTARDEATAEARLQELLKLLDLERQSAEPYVEARSTRTFRIDWNRGSFVRAAQAVVHQFVAAEPVLVRRDSYVAESDGLGGQKLVHYDQLEPLLTHLAGDESYVGASVLAKGPKGRVLRLHVHDDCSVLELRSSFESGQFADLVKAFRKGGLILAEPKPAEEPTRRGFWGQFWRAEGLPGHFATLLAGGAVTGIGFLAVNAMPSYDIQLMRPFARADQPAVVDAGCVEVTWLVIQNHWPKSGTRLEGEVGDVNLGPAGGRRLAPIRDHRSGSEIHVPPGRWTLSVSDVSRGAVSPVIEVVAEDGGYADRRDMAVGRCGAARDSDR